MGQAFLDSQVVSVTIARHLIAYSGQRNEAAIPQAVTSGEVNGVELKGKRTESAGFQLRMYTRISPNGPDLTTPRVSKSDALICTQYSALSPSVSILVFTNQAMSTNLV